MPSFNRSGLILYHKAIKISKMKTNSIITNIKLKHSTRTLSINYQHIMKLTTITVFKKVNRV